MHTYSIALGAYPGFDPGLVARAVDEIQRWATVELAGAARRAGATRRHLAVGNPAEAILELAQRLNPLLVVLGTHHRQGVARLYMGSVAEWVLRRSTCPVLIVPCHDPMETRDAQDAEPRAAGAR